MNLGTLIGAMLALVVAVALACAVAACTDDDCQTWGTVLLSLRRTRSIQHPSSVTRKTTIGEALSELHSEPRKANGESLLAISKSLSKVNAAVEDQKVSNPKLAVEENSPKSDHKERPVRHARTEEVAVASQVRSPKNTSDQRVLQSAASQVQHLGKRRNQTLRAAIARTRHRLSLAKNVTSGLQRQDANRSFAQKTAPRPSSPVAQAPELLQGQYSGRGPWLPGLLPPINLAALASLWHRLRYDNGTAVGREMAVSHIHEGVRIVEAVRQNRRWLLIALAVAFTVSIVLAWRCLFSSQGGNGRLPGFDNLEHEDYSHEAWVLHPSSSSGKRSSGNVFIPPLALQAANLPSEKARSSNPVPGRNPDPKEPRIRLF